MAKPKHSFLTKQLGSCLGRGGGTVYSAGPKTVEWDGGNVIHPDQIEKIYCYGKGCKPTKKKKLDLPDGRTVHTMWFYAPYNKWIKYSAVVDQDGNPTLDSYYY